MTTFIDTNIIIYLLKPNDPMHARTKSEIDKRKQLGPLIINDIVYSELSGGMKNQTELDEALSLLGFERLQMSNQALFHAGSVYAKYRKNGGSKNNVLSDYLIGAQATTEGEPLMTVNAGDFRNLFPELVLIIP